MTGFFHFTRHLHRRVIALLIGLITLFGWWITPADPAFAESLITRETADYQQLSQEISALQAKSMALNANQAQRLGDLQLLEAAIADSNDRATLTNGTSHNLGLFARSKKVASDQPASFYVLAPGHASDDDFEVVALYLPAQVSLDWEGSSSQVAATSPRLVRVLSGEELEVSEPDGAFDRSDVAYRLNLPAFAVESQISALASVPSLTQQQLDEEPETAPVD